MKKQKKVHASSLMLKGLINRDGFQAVLTKINRNRLSNGEPPIKDVTGVRYGNGYSRPLPAVDRKYLRTLV